MKNATARQFRQLNSEFSTNKHYLEGTESVVADCLSRFTDFNHRYNVVFEELRPLDFGEINDEQAVDSEIYSLVRSDTNSMQLSYVQEPETNKRFWVMFHRNNLDQWYLELFANKCSTHYMPCHTLSLRHHKN